MSLDLETLKHRRERFASEVKSYEEHRDTLRTELADTEAGLQRAIAKVAEVDADIVQAVGS